MANQSKQEGARRRSKKDPNGDGVGRASDSLRNAKRVTGSNEEPQCPSLRSQRAAGGWAAETGGGSAGKKARGEGGGEEVQHPFVLGRMKAWGGGCR